MKVRPLYFFALYSILQMKGDDNMCKYIRAYPYFKDDDIVILDVYDGRYYEIYLRKNDSYWWPRNMILLRSKMSRMEADTFLIEYKKNRNKDIG